MLHVDSIKNGVVIDHIRSGAGHRIFTWLGLDKADYSVALLMNVPSETLGRKDIIKIDTLIDIDYSVLGFIDPNITVNVISDQRIVKKIILSLPDRVENVIKCRNPRCITSSEPYVAHVFRLIDRKRAEYCCEYCDELYRAGVGEFI